MRQKFHCHEDFCFFVFLCFLFAMPWLLAWNFPIAFQAASQQLLLDALIWALPIELLVLRLCYLQLTIHTTTNQQDELDQKQDS